jgi:deoxycytidine triphosphate deaminase
LISQSRGLGDVYKRQPDKDGYWYLNQGTYEIVMENIVSVGEGEAGWVITRSTLNRNGVFITSGLYDSGYHGVMAGAMHITCGPMIIKKGTRVGQFLLFKSETLKLYDGDYGLDKAHDQKYTKG